MPQIYLPNRLNGDGSLDSQNYTKVNILSPSISFSLVRVWLFNNAEMLYVCVRRRQGQKWYYHFIYRPNVIHNWNVSSIVFSFFFRRKTKREQHLKLYHWYFKFKCICELISTVDFQCFRVWKMMMGNLQKDTTWVLCAQISNKFNPYYWIKVITSSTWTNFNALARLVFFLYLFVLMIPFNTWLCKCLIVFFFRWNEFRKNMNTKSSNFWTVERLPFS